MFDQVKSKAFNQVDRSRFLAKILAKAHIQASNSYCYHSSFFSATISILICCKDLCFPNPAVCWCGFSSFYLGRSPATCSNLENNSNKRTRSTTISRKLINSFLKSSSLGISLLCILQEQFLIWVEGEIRCWICLRDQSWIEKRNFIIDRLDLFSLLWPVLATYIVTSPTPRTIIGSCSAVSGGISSDKSST